jgi:predicted enzyme related to lactoylglutathione lyase
MVQSKIVVLGWQFMPSFPTPNGDYHLFAYAKEGGGIRQTNPAETPAVLPFVHVENTQEAFDAAIREGAEAVAGPERVMEGVATALVRAPRGILIGFSGP